jgi:hypothetical protein
MQAGGNAQDFFLDVLPDGFIPEILELVPAAWERMRKPDRNAWEPRITALLRDAFIAEYEARYADQSLPFFVFHEHQLTDPVTGKELARTDLEIYMRQLKVKGQKPYFVFESKRLNVRFDTGFSSNAAAYVGEEGMMRFVTGKYGDGASFSGMLGYVMDGEVPRARKAVDGAIQREAKRLCLRDPHQIAPSRHMPGQLYNGETRHASGNREFSIYHLFLAM